MELWFPEIRIWLIHWKLSLPFVTPASTLMAVLAAARDCLRTRAALQMEVLALRHQLNVLRRSVKRSKLTALRTDFSGPGCRGTGPAGGLPWSS